MQMTRQDAFDQIVAHMRHQRAFSIGHIDGQAADEGEEPGCRYRGDNGMKCAVGALIPDDLYSPFMEGKGATALEVTNRMGWDDPNFAFFLFEAQCSLHDSLYRDWRVFDAEAFEEAAQSFALRHGLIYTKVPVYVA